MIRIYTYLTLVAGLPTVAGTYFDVKYAESDSDLGNNTIVMYARNGMPLIVHDSQLQLPVSCTLSMLSTHLDLESETAYLGSTRYLASALYIHYLHHEPICIFQRNIRGQSPKAYLCYFAERGFDRPLAGQVNTTTEERTHLARINPTKAFTFNFVVMRDGKFTDYDDITSVVWLDRF